MAQLPPKAPTMAQKWPSFGYHQTSQPPSWMDDFVDFASARRNSHRRSVSDPIAFVEAPVIMNHESRNSNANVNDSLIPCSNNDNNNNNGFERLDDEQLSSMFSDDVCTAAANLQSVTSLRNHPSSDQNSDNDEQKPNVHELQEQPPSSTLLKNEPGEVEDGGDYEEETESVKPPFTFSGEGGTTIVDPKRVKRILANRQSAQRSRVRKLHYISELERSVTTLQTEVSTLSPRVAFLDHQRLILNVDNSSLKQRIAALAQDKIFKDAHQEALKKEIERLRRVYHDQQHILNKQQQPDNTATLTTSGSPAAMTSPAATVDGTDG